MEKSADFHSDDVRNRWARQWRLLTTLILVLDVTPVGTGDRDVHVAGTMMSDSVHAQTLAYVGLRWPCWHAICTSYTLGRPTYVLYTARAVIHHPAPPIAPHYFIHADSHTISHGR